MATEQFANLAQTTVATGGYTAGSGVLNVLSTGTGTGLSNFPNSPQFRVAIADFSTLKVKAVLLVTSINSSTQWAVTPEIDANANAGDFVYGTMWTAGIAANVVFTGTQTFQKVSEQVLSGSASNVTFASIPQTFRSLSIRYGVVGSTAADLNLQVNGDTGSNYDYHRMYGQNTSFGNAAADGATSTTLVNIGGTPNSGAIFGDVIIPGYSQSSLAWKGIISRWVYNAYMVEVGGIWHSSSAITSIKLFPSSGTFSSGSFFSLYGEM